MLFPVFFTFFLHTFLIDFSFHSYPSCWHQREAFLIAIPQPSPPEGLFFSLFNPFTSIHSFLYSTEHFSAQSFSVQCPVCISHLGHSFSIFNPQGLKATETSVELNQSALPCPQETHPHYLSPCPFRNNLVPFSLISTAPSRTG